jgi:hypothetical protein
MSSSKKNLHVKGIWGGQVLIRVHKLEKHSIMLIFSTQLCELLPLFPSLWFNSPPSLCE